MGSLWPRTCPPPFRRFGCWNGLRAGRNDRPTRPVISSGGLEVAGRLPRTRPHRRRYPALAPIGQLAGCLRGQHTLHTRIQGARSAPGNTPGPGLCHGRWGARAPAWGRTSPNLAFWATVRVRTSPGPTPRLRQSPFRSNARPDLTANTAEGTHALPRAVVLAGTDIGVVWVGAD